MSVNTAFAPRNKHDTTPSNPRTPSQGYGCPFRALIEAARGCQSYHRRPLPVGLGNQRDLAPFWPQLQIMSVWLHVVLLVGKGVRVNYLQPASPLIRATSRELTISKRCCFRGVRSPSSSIVTLDLIRVALARGFSRKLSSSSASSAW